MFAKLKEKTSSSLGSQRSPGQSQEKTRLKPPGDDHLHKMNESGGVSPDTHAVAFPSRQLSRQSSVSSMVSDMSMVSTSQFINDSPMPNIDHDIGSFDLEESSFPQLSSDLSSQDVYSSLVRESRQKLNTAKFKYQDLLTAYKELEKQNAKIREGLAKSQDRAFRKIAELKENEKLTRAEFDKCLQRLNALEQEKLNSQPSQSEIDKYNDRIADLESIVLSRSQENEIIKQEQQKMGAIIASLQAEKVKAEEGLKLATEKAMELKKQLVEKDAMHSIALAECKRNFHNLLEERDIELKNCRLLVDAAKSETEVTKNQMEELKSTITKLEEENSGFRETLEATEKRLEAEKIQVVQEISKAKDAAFEAAQADFQMKCKELQESLDSEIEKRMREAEVSCQQKFAESVEQSKLALEESWLASKAAESKHEQEIEALQSRIAQLSSELDSTRMNLHRRTLEADQSRTALEQLSMQSSSDVEQAVIQCRRELEIEHRAELKKLREELTAKLEAKSLELQENETSTEKQEVGAAWEHVKQEIGNNEKLAEAVSSYAEIISYLLENAARMTQSKIDLEADLNAKLSEKVEAQKLSFSKEIESVQAANSLLKEELSERSVQVSALEARCADMALKLDEADVFRQEVVGLRKQIAESFDRIKHLEAQNQEKLEHASDEVKLLHQQIAALQRQVVEKDGEIQHLNETVCELNKDLKTKDTLLHSKLQLENKLSEVEEKLAALQLAMDDAAKNYSDRVSALESQIESDNRQISSRDKEIQVLEAHKEKQSQALAESIAAVEILKTELQEKALLIKTMESSVQSKAELESERERLLKSNSELAHQLTERTEMLHQLETDMAVFKLKADNLGSLETEKAQLASMISELTAKCQLLETEAESAKERYADVPSLADENKQLLQNIVDKDKDVNVLEQKCSQLQKELDDHFAAANLVIEKLRSIVPSCEGGLVGLIDAVAESQDHLLHKCEHITREKEAIVDQLESLRIEMHQAALTHEQELTELQSAMEQLKTDLADNRAKLNDELKLTAQLKLAIESKESDALEKFTELKTTSAALENESRVLNTQLATVNEQLASEKRQLAQTSDEYHRLSEEMVLLRKEHGFVLAEVAQREKHLTEERNHLNEELKTATIEVRRLETRINALEDDLADSKASDARHQEEMRQASKTVDDLKTKCATLEMELVECKDKMSLSQELVGKLKAELDSSRKTNEEAVQKFAALKTQSAKKLKLLGDEKCALEKQIAGHLTELDALKSSIAATQSDVKDLTVPSIEDMGKKIAELMEQVDIVSKALADREIRIAELELELSDKVSKHEAELAKVRREDEQLLAETEQRVRFEMKRAISDFERQLGERDKQIAKLNSPETTARSGSVDLERQMRGLERELSEKNAAVEQLVVMYEKQLRDQASELRQEASGRMQSQSEKHQAEVNGLMEEFRNETKQWMLERQQMTDEIEHARKDREQMVQELKRLSNLLDNQRSGGTGSPARIGKGASYESPYLAPSSSGAGSSSVMTGSIASPSLNNGAMAMQLHEATEYEYLRNILLEYMLGRETSILWRVIGTVMRFSEDQMAEIAAREESRSRKWL